MTADRRADPSSRRTRAARSHARLVEIRATARSRSPFPGERTEEILRARFARIPKRLEFALRRWPLESSSVLDVGCAHGHCLAHFGPGSLGVDNVEEHVDFCRAIGLEAILADAGAGLDRFPSAAFDFVWVSDIVEHLDAPRRLLRNAVSALKPGGRLLLFVTALPRSRLLRRALRTAHIDAFDAHAHHYQFTYETARHLLERAGLHVTSVAVPGIWLPPGLSSLARAQVPRLFLEARPRPEAERLARDAERRNRSGGS